MKKVITVSILSRKAESAISRLQDLGFVQADPDSRQWWSCEMEWDASEERHLAHSITSHARRTARGVDWDIAVEDEGTPLRRRATKQAPNRYTTSRTGTQPEDVNDGSAY